MAAYASVQLATKRVLNAYLPAMRFRDFIVSRVSALASVFTCFGVAKYFFRREERQADNDGLHALDCADCAREIADLRPLAATPQGQAASGAGYLTREEILQVAEELHGHTCARHQHVA